MIQQITIDPMHTNFVTVDIDDARTQGRPVTLVSINCPICGAASCVMDWKAFFLAGIGKCSMGQYYEFNPDQKFAIQFIKD